jgi:hypothetical protein
MLKGGKGSRGTVRMNKHGVRVNTPAEEQAHSESFQAGAKRSSMISGTEIMKTPPKQRPTFCGLVRAGNATQRTTRRKFGRLVRASPDGPCSPGLPGYPVGPTGGPRRRWSLAFSLALVFPTFGQPGFNAGRCPVPVLPLGRGNPWVRRVSGGAGAVDQVSRGTSPGPKAPKN